MPFKLNPYEEGLLRDYIKIYKHSPLSIKMVLCAYYARTYTGRYIDFDTYLSYCISYYNTHLNALPNKLDYLLLKQWDLLEPWKSHFFGFDVKTIRFGSITDVEKMVTEIYVEYKRNNNEQDTLANGLYR